MPVQRIPRYQLLLTELLKRTPEDHTDYKHIKEALSTIMFVANRCNKAMNEDKDNSLKLSIQNSIGPNFQLMKASRKLLKYGPALWTHGSKEEKVILFLFSDLLIFTNEFDTELNLKVLAKYEICNKLITNH